MHYTLCTYTISALHVEYCHRRCTARLVPPPQDAVPHARAIPEVAVEPVACSSLAWSASDPVWSRTHTHTVTHTHTIAITSVAGHRALKLVPVRPRASPLVRLPDPPPSRRQSQSQDEGVGGGRMGWR
eukprot:638166-Rhodomonas_salina.4